MDQKIRFETLYEWLEEYRRMHADPRMIHAPSIESSKDLEAIISIVDNWSATHPKKTNRQVFQETFGEDFWEVHHHWHADLAEWLRQPYIEPDVREALLERQKAQEDLSEEEVEDILTKAWESRKADSEWLQRHYSEPSKPKTTMEPLTQEEINMLLDTTTPDECDNLMDMYYKEESGEEVSNSDDHRDGRIQDIPDNGSGNDRSAEGQDFIKGQEVVEDRDEEVRNERKILEELGRDLPNDARLAVLEAVLANRVEG